MALEVPENGHSKGGYEATIDMISRGVAMEVRTTDKTIEEVARERAREFAINDPVGIMKNNNNEPEDPLMFAGRDQDLDECVSEIARACVFEDIRNHTEGFPRV